MWNELIRRGSIAKFHKALCAAPAAPVCAVSVASPTRSEPALGDESVARAGVRRKIVCPRPQPAVHRWKRVYQFHRWRAVLEFAQ